MKTKDEIFVPNRGVYFPLYLYFDKYEKALEEVIIPYFKEIYPEFFVYKFKSYTFQAVGLEPHQCDFIMIKNDYTEWWVVEIEKKGHPYKHIVDQINCFTNADSDKRNLANKICSLNPSIVKAKVEDMIDNIEKNTLVVLDREKKELEGKLKKYKTKICYFRIYKGYNATNVFKLDGSYPIIEYNKIICKKEGIFLECFPPPGHKFFNSNDSNLEVIYDCDSDYLVEFKIECVKKRIYLRNLSSCLTLPAHNEYILYEDSQHNYHLRFN